MKKQVLLFFLMIMPLMASAYDVEIDGIYYNLNQETKEAEVTNNGTNGQYTGDILIPETVSFEGVSYSVTLIGNYAFLYCSSLSSVTIPNSVTSIGQMTFYGCTSLTSVTIPNSVTYIGDDAFGNCSGLTSVTIPNSVTYIGGWVFINCSGLASVSIGYGISTIPKYSFYGCSSLISVIIPDYVTTIGANAFYGCSELTSITMGSGIKTIGNMAFAGCESLEDVYCHAEKVPLTETDAFDNSYIAYATLHVPEKSVSQYERREPWSGFGIYAGIPEKVDDGNKCAKPIITILANGKVKVESATEGATCITTITASNADPLTNGEISLNTPLTVYTVTAYATAEGYDDSDVTTSTFRWEKAEGDMNGDGVVNISDVIQLVNLILEQ